MMVGFSALVKKVSSRCFSVSTREWRVYLSGEIHSNWRETIAQGVKDRKLPVILTSANTSHEDSDDCGAIILGDEEKRPNYDNKGAKMNLIRTKTLISEADIVVVRFGEKYRQWNAAFDAGFATALSKPLITLHPLSLGHPLKEVNASALAVCEEPTQIVDILDYTISGALPPPRDGTNFIPMQDRMGPGNPNP
uniref:YtoQ family protein n=1 Tax=Aureoumbra lagunensis TaxID=44058 RepID=A0A7S3NPL3_9STRA|mmetsp:Transcript_2637/g.3581  ORF Transcript_2637/g.3581 Transcript_2637/m.3581 type:complete len:194 (-) Transcript_2637:45-626(-)